jgi:hypothetical protein
MAYNPLPELKQHAEKCHMAIMLMRGVLPVKEWCKYEHLFWTGKLEVRVTRKMSNEFSCYYEQPQINLILK